jgi:hypothetical protein
VPPPSLHDVQAHSVLLAECSKCLNVAGMQLSHTLILTRGQRLHSTAQHSTAQHSTAQHSTAQHSTAQHSTALQSSVCCEHTKKESDRGSKSTGCCLVIGPARTPQQCLQDARSCRAGACADVAGFCASAVQGLMYYTVRLCQMKPTGSLTDEADCRGPTPSCKSVTCITTCSHLSKHHLHWVWACREDPLEHLVPQLHGPHHILLTKAQHRHKGRACRHTAQQQVI